VIRRVDAGNDGDGFPIVWRRVVVAVVVDGFSGLAVDVAAFRHFLLAEI